MAAKIDIDALKIFKKSSIVRLKIGKKLKIASFNTGFTISKKRVFFDLFTFEKFLNLLLL